MSPMVTPGRDALAKALTGHRLLARNAAGRTGCRGCTWQSRARAGGISAYVEHSEHLIDALLASGAVTTLAEAVRGLAEDEALQRGDVAEAVWLHRSFGVDMDDYTAKCGCGRKFVTAVDRQRHAAQEVLRALADALTVDQPAEGVTSAEPGCTCGGMAACPQCQDRDAETRAEER